MEKSIQYLESKVAFRFDPIKDIGKDFVTLEHAKTALRISQKEYSLEYLKDLLEKDNEPDFRRESRENRIDQLESELEALMKS